MLTYFLGGYNSYNIRTKQIPSGSNIMVVYTENMTSLDDYAFNAGSWSYNECESIVGITFNLEIPLGQLLTPGSHKIKVELYDSFVLVAKWEAIISVG